MAPTLSLSSLAKATAILASLALANAQTSPCGTGEIMIGLDFVSAHMPSPIIHR